MKIKGIISVIILSLILISAAGCNKADDQQAEKAQSYPERPITCVIPYGTGGGADQFGRMLIQVAGEVNPNIKITPVNMAGAMTNVALEHTMKQPADGYTIMIITQDTLLNMVVGNSTYTLNNLKPVIRAQQNVDMWFINSAETRFKNFDEMIQYASEHPGELKIGTTGLDGTDAMAIKKVEQSCKVSFTNMPFDQPGERYAALAGGHIDILHEQPGDIGNFLESKDYTPILVMSDEPIKGFEQVPTSVSKGIDWTAGFWRGIAVKEGTPDEVVNTLADLFSSAMKQETYTKYEKEKYLDLRPGYMDQEEFALFIENEFKYFKEELGKE